jgi:hypothetical protein
VQDKGTADLDGDGELGVGDLLTVEYYPLHAGWQEVELRLRAVGT